MVLTLFSKGFKPLTTGIVYRKGLERGATAINNSLQRLYRHKGFKPITTRIVYKKGFNPGSSTNNPFLYTIPVVSGFYDSVSQIAN